MKRNRHSPNEKAKIVLETFRGEKTLSEIAAENNVHPNLLSKWKKAAITGLPTLFEEENLQKRRILKAHEEEKSELYKQIGKLTTELEWLKKNLHNSVCEPQRRQLVDFAEEFSIAKQAELLGINRATLYYKSKISSEKYLKINRFIDEIYTAYPLFGYRRITVWLADHYGI